MLNEFLNGWQRGKEWYFVQHKEIRADGEEVWWREVPVGSLTELISALKAMPARDNFLTGTRYASPSRAHDDPIYHRGWMDFDFHDLTEVEVFSELSKLRKVQDALRDKDGNSPITLIFSGRGFHLYFYFDSPVTLAQATRVRRILSAGFDLRPDPKVPIEGHRQLRLPGFIHGKTKTPLFSVWCTERMSQQDVREAAVRGILRWDPVHPVPLEYYLRWDPGEIVIEEHFASQVTPSSAPRVVELGAGEDILLSILAKQARAMRSEGVSIDDIAVRIRRTRSDVMDLLSNA